jgi:hypothetical protein
MAWLSLAGEEAPNWLRRRSSSERWRSISLRARRAAMAPLLEPHGDAAEQHAERDRDEQRDEQVHVVGECRIVRRQRIVGQSDIARVGEREGDRHDRNRDHDDVVEEAFHGLPSLPLDREGVSARWITL